MRELRKHHIITSIEGFVDRITIFKYEIKIVTIQEPRFFINVKAIENREQRVHCIPTVSPNFEFFDGKFLKQLSYYQV